MKIQLAEFLSNLSTIGILQVTPFRLSCDPEP